MLLFLSTPCLALTDAQLIAVRDGFGDRRDQMLAQAVASPWPDMTTVWGKQVYALAALYSNVEPNQANHAVIDACDQLLNDPCCPWVL